MNIFKFGRGDFIGIIIPGIFLLINLIIFYTNQLTCFNNQVLKFDFINNNAITITLFFVISYIFGFALRLIKPTILEKLSSLLWSPIYIAKSIYEYFINIFNKNKINLKQVIIQRTKAYWESYPYIEWFYAEYFSKSAKSIQNFFVNLLKNEYNNNKELLKDTNFINQSKIYILEHSKTLYDELIFSEGLVRFLSGMSIALLISIIIIVTTKADVDMLLYIYILLTIIFLLKLRHIRVKEAATIFISLAFLKEPVGKYFCK